MPHRTSADADTEKKKNGRGGVGRGVLYLLGINTVCKSCDQKMKAAIGGNIRQDKIRQDKNHTCCYVFFSHKKNGILVSVKKVGGENNVEVEGWEGGRGKENLDICVSCAHIVHIFKKTKFDKIKTHSEHTTKRGKNKNRQMSLSAYSHHKRRKIKKGKKKVDTAPYKHRLFI